MIVGNNHVNRNKAAMDRFPQPTPTVSALPALTPFTGPETIERRSGIPFRLRLGANESLFGPSPSALEAMTAAAAKGYLYGDPENWELRAEIASRFAARLANVELGSGIDELLFLFARAFLGPRDAVVTSAGGYPTFDYVVAGCGGRIEKVPYKADRVDLDGLAAKAIEVKAKLVYLANPDNPSGSWQTAEEVKRLSEALPPETLLLLDEAYADFVPLSELPDITLDNPGVVRLRTFSKAHGLAGLRVGYVVGHPAHIMAIDKIRLHFGVNAVAQAGALASLRDELYVGSVVGETNVGRSELEAGVQALGIPTLPSRTNFVCLDFTSRERAEQILAALAAKGVFVRKPGAPPLDRCIRVTIGRQQDVRDFLTELTPLVRTAPR
jgi:histidinol-phosphate aminotransferase